MLTPEQVRSFETISPDLAPYATRKTPRRLDLQRPISRAYLHSRHQDGTLKHAKRIGVEQADVLFSEHMENIQQQGGVFDEEGSHRPHAAALGDEFPEIRSFLARSDKNNPYDTNSDPRMAVKISMNIGATQVEIYADPAEPANLQEQRVMQIADAVSRVHDAGFKIPSPMQFYLPKYTRGIHLPSLKVDNSWNSLAEFYAPNRIMLSPELLRTFIPPNAPDSVALRLKNASAPIVHEIGHCLHFAQAPESYSDLFHTRLARQYERTAGEVSEYGARNPNEFVAETFTAVTFKGVITRDQWNLYQALGGPLSARQAPTPTIGRTLAQNSNLSVVEHRTAGAAARMQPAVGRLPDAAASAPSSWNRRNHEVERPHFRRK